jgi:hypothetical protein
MDIAEMAIQVGGSVICFENMTSELWYITFTTNS